MSLATRKILFYLSLLAPGHIFLILFTYTPQLRPTITFAGAASLVYAVTQIDLVAVITNGGPVNSTTVVFHYIQAVLLESQDFGQASAETVFTVLALARVRVNDELLEKQKIEAELRERQERLAILFEHAAD